MRLLAVYPEACKEADSRGALLLHHAIKLKAAERVLLALLDADPAALRQSDERDGMLPLHIAATYGASDLLLLRLLEGYPEALKVKDRAGSVPKAKAEIYAHVRVSRLLEEAESFDGLAEIKRTTWIKTRIKEAATGLKQEL